MCADHKVILLFYETSYTYIYNIYTHIYNNYIIEAPMCLSLFCFSTFPSLKIITFFMSVLLKSCL
jgi:hypothetical protein